MNEKVKCCYCGHESERMHFYEEVVTIHDVNGNRGNDRRQRVYSCRDIDMCQLTRTLTMITLNPLP